MQNIFQCLKPESDVKNADMPVVKPEWKNRAEPGSGEIMFKTVNLFFCTVCAGDRIADYAHIIAELFRLVQADKRGIVRKMKLELT